jgi:hypothetical protein
VRGDCATVELKYVCNLSYRPKFYAGRYRDVALANTQAAIFIGVGTPGLARG